MMSVPPEQQLRAYVDYLRDMGIYDLYRRDDPSVALPESLRAALTAAKSATSVQNVVVPARPQAGAPVRGAATVSSRASAPPATASGRAAASAFAPPAVPTPATAPTNYFPSDDAPPSVSMEMSAPMPKPKSFDALVPVPSLVVPAAERSSAMEKVRAEIGDCTRCPLAYGGRHKIVFGEGDLSARLMFVGEGPGADEDESGLPFVGKAGQLLNNMIGAMGLQREQVYIANIVKCRPPANRTPEYVEATTCSQFLIQQIDVVKPQVIVALGATAATYLLGVKQSLASLRGSWHEARGAKVAVTYHPAFLLRDPRQKGEAWKDLQRVMGELGLQGARPKPTA
jgi:uracil-DNA glycosylase family 4